MRGHKSARLAGARGDSVAHFASDAPGWRIALSAFVASPNCSAVEVFHGRRSALVYCALQVSASAASRFSAAAVPTTKRITPSIPMMEAAAAQAIEEVSC